MNGVFALELGGTPIDRFNFPRGGVVLVGSEELGLSPEAIRLADAQGGRVSIPLGGAKRSLNVSVAFGILMHAWRRSLTQEAP
jgi:TrmH family RNA methyltransferase